MIQVMGAAKERTNNRTDVLAMMKRAKGTALETHLAKKLRR